MSVLSGNAATALVRAELRARRGALLRFGAWSLVQALPQTLSGVAVARAVDDFLAGRWWPGATWLGVLMTAALLSATATYRQFPWLRQIVDPIRDALLAAVVSAAVTAAVQAGGRPDASGVAQLSTQVQSVRGVLGALLRAMRQVVVSIGGAVVGLFLLGPTAALLCGLPVLAAGGLFAMSLAPLARRYRAALAAAEQYAHHAGEVLGAARDVLAHGADDYALSRVDAAARAEASADRALGNLVALRGIYLFIGGPLPLGLLLMTAPWLLRHGYLGYGEVVGTATYLTVSLSPALRALLDAVGTWGLDLLVTLDRLSRRFVAARTDQTAGVPLPAGRDLRLEQLSFTYGSRAEPVLHNLTFTVAEGDHLAVLGPSGIGKSTLAAVAAGLLVPTAGTVRLGGVDLANLDVTQLRQLIGFIPQEAYVFAGSLDENLRYLAPDTDPVAVAAAVQTLGLGPMVSRLGGLDTAIGAGGAHLSDGERQLVALTRVYLSPARIVLLDEATCHLDPEAEARVEQAFASRLDTTLLVIAHRVTSALRARRVLVLDGDGSTVGTHEILMRTSPTYAELVGYWQTRPEHDDLAPPTTAVHQSAQGAERR
ncbi:ATP-binding cassette domain-containing protein [Micromonospora auratinigra]|uniref:ATP-binding cassette, subfamily C n=1 Tax=Micromonospora auratinigra TaxID=261654 RepID=A0A1A8Z4V1_9ACTN|nr:ABC transporter ATP-binding protein [Micromonospora auratinigra]SBT38833.1 ATP-binding cassette, subfamily C [Micromonospora auratinigra]